MLPQLNSLRSTTAGFQSKIIPPPLALEDDKRPKWVSNESYKGNRVFCHGDLIDHNVLVHRETLQPVALLDWEHAGYFVPELQMWFRSRKEYDDLYNDKERMRRLTAHVEA